MATPVVPRTSSRLRPSTIENWAFTDGVWAAMQEVNRSSFLPHVIGQLRKTGWLNNFHATAARTLATERVGRLFTDSEIYKTAEAICWEVTREDSAELRGVLDEYAQAARDAQADDGYISTFYGWDGGPDRYTDFEMGHELYCMGHLIQAGVAAARTGASEKLVEVAVRAADHICAEFGEDGRQTLCGHPEIETALVELYRTTGDRKYLEQARIFVERRGHRTLADTMFKGRAYYQDDIPVREVTVLAGHAVRALYLAAGAIDVAVETEDAELLAVLEAQYRRTWARRTYLTGGMGSNHMGETFGEDFELPAERAYAETCAAVASIHVAWRLLLATGDESYADAIERTLYNSILSSPSWDGQEFFYVNTLQRRVPGIAPEPGGPSVRRTDGMRAAWFTTSCCPTNVARLLSSFGSMVATTSADGVQVHQYGSGVLTTDVPGLGSVRLTVQTDYPVSGEVTVTVDEAPNGDGVEWELSLRVPDWAAGARVAVNGADDEASPGRWGARRAWTAGDRVILSLPMQARLTTADPRIDAVRGCVAVERGPIVYALESPDQPEVDLMSVALAPAPVFTEVAGTACPGQALPDLETDGVQLGISDEDWPYRRAGEGTPIGSRAVRLRLIPYYLWANRGSSTMRIWIPLQSTEPPAGA